MGRKLNGPNLPRCIKSCATGLGGARPGGYEPD
jgi:hypothetical protein